MLSAGIGRPVRQQSEHGFCSSTPRSQLPTGCRQAARRQHVPPAYRGARPVPGCHALPCKLDQGRRRAPDPTKEQGGNHQDRPRAFAPLGIRRSITCRWSPKSSVSSAVHNSYGILEPAPAYGTTTSCPFARATLQATSPHLPAAPIPPRVPGIPGRFSSRAAIQPLPLEGNYPCTEQQEQGRAEDRAAPRSKEYPYRHRSSKELILLTYSGTREFKEQLV